MPRNWLNIFTAVRNANDFEAEQDQRVVENKRADEDQGFQRAAQQRVATDWDTERATRTTLGALGAYSNMVDTINSGVAEAERPQAYAAAFDRIAPALEASGYDPERIAGLRENLVANPSSAADLLSGLRSSGEGSQASLQAGFDDAGQPVYVNPTTGRPVRQGAVPATAVLGDRRVAIAQQNADTSAGNLEVRTNNSRPDAVFAQSAARAEGREAGAAAQALPAALESVERARETVGRIQSTDPEVLQSVLGVPSISGIFRGGAGMFGSIPGTASADAAADVEQAISQARLSMYESLRGAGQITEAESLFGAQAFTNLTRARTEQSFRAELQRFQDNLNRAERVLTRSAATSRNPNSRTPAASAPAEAQGFDVDAFLSQRGY